jgi:hypothetical protein
MRTFPRDMRERKSAEQQPERCENSGFGAPASQAAILRLQGSIGNAAVAQVISGSRSEAVTVQKHPPRTLPEHEQINHSPDMVTQGGHGTDRSHWRWLRMADNPENGAPQVDQTWIAHPTFRVWHIEGIAGVLRDELAYRQRGGNALGSLGGPMGELFLMNTRSGRAVGSEVARVAAGFLAAASGELGRSAPIPTPTQSRRGVSVPNTEAAWWSQGSIRRRDAPTGSPPASASGSTAAMTTARRRLGANDILDMRRRRVDVLVFRSRNQDVVANRGIAPQHETNPTSPEYVFFGEGFEGFNYGDYFMCIERDRVTPLYRNPNSPGEWYTTSEIPASEGYWYSIDDLRAAGFGR